MNRTLLNPYELFGLDVNNKNDIDVDKVKKIYRNFALFTHPDRGGNKLDFIAVHNAYKYIMKQVKNCKDMVDMDVLEEDFKNYCEQNPIEKIPTLMELRDDIMEFNRKFNEQFEEQKVDDDSFYLFKDNGYGHLMDNSEISSNNDTENLTHTRTNFKMNVMVYDAPTTLPDDGYGDYVRFDITDDLDNFGNVSKNLYDYRETHAEKNPTPLDNTNVIDAPIENFEERMEQLMLDRVTMEEEDIVMRRPGSGIRPTYEQRNTRPMQITLEFNEEQKEN